MSLIFLGVLIAWLGLVLAGLVHQVRAEFDAEEQRHRQT